MPSHGFRVFFAGAIGLLATSQAATAQMPDATGRSFTGPYIGVAAGFGRHQADIDNLTVGTSFSDDDTAFTAGGYAGYSWQAGPFIVGIETDLNILTGSPTSVENLNGPGGLTETTTLNSEIDWFGTLRARAGFAVNESFLLFGTGGLAYARVDHTLSDNCVACGTSLFNLGPFSQSDEDTKLGWTVGGGGEYRYGSRWSLRAEALFVDLGSETHTYVVTSPVGTAVATAKWDDEFWVARLGVTYKLAP